MRPGSGSLALRLLPLVLAAVVYYPATRTYFLADDFVCFYHIVDQGFVRFVLEPFGGHVLLVRNLVFYLCWRLFGLSPAPYGWVALLTHLLNVGLLFGVVRRVTGSAVLACFGATLWGTSPVNAGALGWYSVYGQVLVATTTLLLLGDVARVAAGERPPSAARVFAWMLLAWTGATCFGVGIGIALAIPMVAFVAAPVTWRDRRVRWLLLALPPATVGLYAGLLWLDTIFVPPALDQVFLMRTFFNRPRAFVRMLWHLVAFGIYGTTLGFLHLRWPYPGVVSHAVVAGWVGLAAAAAGVGGAWARRWIVAAVALVLAVYGMIALGRSNAYATFGQDLAVAGAVLRYHYVAGVPLALGLCTALAALARRAGVPVPARALLAAWLVVAAVAYRGSNWRIDPRDTQRQYVLSTLQAMDDMIDAEPPGAVVLLPNQHVPWFILGPVFGHAQFPGWAALFALANPTDQVRGRTVRFVEQGSKVLDAVRAGAGRRLPQLLVGPDEAPAG